MWAPMAHMLEEQDDGRLCRRCSSSSMNFPAKRRARLYSVERDESKGRLLIEVGWLERTGGEQRAVELIGAMENGGSGDGFHSGFGRGASWDYGKACAHAGLDGRG